MGWLLNHEIYSQVSKFSYNAGDVAYSITGLPWNPTKKLCYLRISEFFMPFVKMQQKILDLMNIYTIITINWTVLIQARNLYSAHSADCQLPNLMIRRACKFVKPIWNIKVNFFGGFESAIYTMRWTTHSLDVKPFVELKKWLNMNRNPDKENERTLWYRFSIRINYEIHTWIENPSFMWI